jgi:hypothetical protein
MNVLKNSRRSRLPGAHAASRRARPVADKPVPPGTDWRQGLAGLVGVISRQDFGALRGFCEQLTNSPELVMALFGIMEATHNGDIQSWPGVPESFGNVVRLTADHLALMKEALEDGDLGDVGIEPGTWLLVEATIKGTTRISIGWFDLDLPPDNAEFYIYTSGEFGTAEAALLYLLVADLVDFPTFGGYEVPLN